MDKAPADPVAWGPQMCRILQFVVDSFGLEFILLTESSILDSCNEI
jgi:hypothetical protein